MAKTFFARSPAGLEEINKQLFDVKDLLAKKSYIQGVKKFLDVDVSLTSDKLNELLPAEKERLSDLYTDVARLNPIVSGGQDPSDEKSFSLLEKAMQLNPLNENAKKEYKSLTAERRPHLFTPRK